jgi:hypothetical protein
MDNATSYLQQRCKAKTTHNVVFCYAERGESVEASVPTAVAIDAESKFC